MMMMMMMKKKSCLVVIILTRLSGRYDLINYPSVHPLLQLAETKREPRSSLLTFRLYTVRWPDPLPSRIGPEIIHGQTLFHLGLDQKSSMANVLDTCTASRNISMNSGPALSQGSNCWTSCHRPGKHRLLKLCSLQLWILNQRCCISNVRA